MIYNWDLNSRIPIVTVSQGNLEEKSTETQSRVEQIVDKEITINRGAGDTVIEVFTGQRPGFPRDDRA